MSKLTEWLNNDSNRSVLADEVDALLPAHEREVAKSECEAICQRIEEVWSSSNKSLEMVGHGLADEIRRDFARRWTEPEGKGRG